VSNQQIQGREPKSQSRKRDPLSPAPVHSGDCHGDHYRKRTPELANAEVIYRAKEHKQARATVMNTFDSL
jgi:hypothetical protein